MKQIKKILVANRGEIALRIMRTIRQRSIVCVAVYSDADRNAPYVRFADEGIAIGGLSAAESYLDQDKIIDAAKRTGADAIHPGYGFLAENPTFAARCEKEGIIFIGPTSKVIQQLGSKAGAKEIMRKAAVPVVPGYEGEDQSAGRFKYEAGEIGFPVLLKASAGGGGKGMRIVNNEGELEAAIEAASREAQKSFGDGKLLMEKYFPKAKHIEVQILGDEHGNYIHLNERECSMQRRYQKVIEEAPSPSLTPELRDSMTHAALEAARAVGYTGAGTVEFLLDDNNDYYFLEVNTRLQVEHPVTELTTGVDIVSIQIDIAQGKPLELKQEDVQQYGHSIECRICAEDPENGFFPATGKILQWMEPDAFMKVRFDSGVTVGSYVDVHYDSMLAKCITVANNRKQAIQDMLQALEETVVMGVTTNIQFLKELLRNPAFHDGSFDTKLIEREYAGYTANFSEIEKHELVMAAALWGWLQRSEKVPFTPQLNGWRNIFYKPQQFAFDFKGEVISGTYRKKAGNSFDMTVGDKCYEVELSLTTESGLSLTVNGHLQHYMAVNNEADYYVHRTSTGTVKLKAVPRFTEPGSDLKKDGYYSPMPGEVIKVLVKPGDKVSNGQRLLIMSSMKMETAIEAHADGTVEEVYVTEKSFVEANTALVKVV